MAFAGCSRETSGKIIRYELSGGIANLDPQFATDADARMIILNIYEGLVAHGPDGGVLPGVAESWDISPDGLKYTFKLRENALWSDGKPVTAADFVFAFFRLFSPGGASPFAQDYDMIENAAEILAGQALLSRLGVRAVSETELEIRLARPSPFFLERLAETPAMPCNKEVFGESRGRYGLEAQFVISNGVFYLERWDNEKYIYLRPNDLYTPEKAAAPAGVNLYIGRENPASDYAEVPYETAIQLQTQDYTVESYEKTVWCVVFNENSPVWGSPLLRQGLAAAVDPEMLAEMLPQKFTPTSLLVPPACTLAGQSYRALADASPVSFDSARGQYLFKMGLETLVLGRLPPTVFYVPDSADHLLAMGMVQQSWQKHLSAYVNIEPAALSDIKRRYETGDYDILLLPITSVTPRAESVLQMFASGSRENHTGYNSDLFDRRLSDAESEKTLVGAAKYYALAESLLLSDAVVIPVYTETSAFAAASGISGITGAPYVSRLVFRNAGKNV